jgi:hypothetical protein
VYIVNVAINMIRVVAASATAKAVFAVDVAAVAYVC